MRKVIAFASAITLALCLAACGSAGTTGTSSSSTTVAASTMQDNSHKAGSYRIGKDVPAGLYRFQGGGDGSELASIKVYPDAQHTQESDVTDTEVFSDVYWMSVTDGEVIQTSSCSFLAEADVQGEHLTSLPTTYSTMLRVGVDIQPGDYELTAGLPDSMHMTSGTIIGFVFLYDAPGNQNTAKSSNSFENNAYVTLVDGQYVELHECKADPAAS
jgi:hypothetical protein